MFKLVLITALLGLGSTGALANANSSFSKFEVACPVESYDQKGLIQVPRAESVDVLRYQFDLAKNKMTLVCGEKSQDRIFCGSMRMDSAQVFPIRSLDKCSKQNPSIRRMATVKIDQEDEFNNLIQLFFNQSCATPTLDLQTGQVEAPVAAIVISMATGDLPRSDLKLRPVPCTVTPLK